MPRIASLSGAKGNVKLALGGNENDDEQHSQLLLDFGHRRNRNLGEPLCRSSIRGN
jgi:hypothetical protein